MKQEKRKYSRQIVLKWSKGQKGSIALSLLPAPIRKKVKQFARENKFGKDKFYYAIYTWRRRSEDTKGGVVELPRVEVKNKLWN